MSEETAPALSSSKPLFLPIGLSSTEFSIPLFLSESHYQAELSLPDQYPAVAQSRRKNLAQREEEKP